MSDEHSPIARIPELRWLHKIIVERAITRGEYLLSGGARSDYYIDKFRLFADPHVLRRIARLFAPIVSEISPDLIGGTELGGVIIATAVSQMTGIPMIVVRKKPKQYGAFADEYVEGPFEGEVLAARARLEELNLKVTLYAIVSRGLAPINSLIQFSLPRGEAKTDN
jgi:hypothetical protein